MFINEGAQSTPNTFFKKINVNEHNFVIDFYLFDIAANCSLYHTKE